MLDTDVVVSRRDTTLVKTAYLAQLSLLAEFGRRSWVHRALRLRVAESRSDRALAADIIRRRHVLARWPCRPRTLMLSYLADLDGLEPSGDIAAALAVVALLPGQYHVTRALELAQHEVLTLTRLWRADDLRPSVAPDFTPEVLRRIVGGDRRHGDIRSLREEWISRKCRIDGLRAKPRLLVSYADPALGHDGAVYLAAGAVFCGHGRGGKLAFAWGLDEEACRRLRELGAAVAEHS